MKKQLKHNCSNKQLSAQQNYKFKTSSLRHLSREDSIKYNRLNELYFIINKQRKMKIESGTQRAREKSED